MRDFFFQRTQAQGAVETARHGQLAGRAGAHGQADQAGVAPAVARLGDGGFEAKAGAEVGEVEGVGDGGGDGAGFFRRDAGAAHGLLEGFAATDLDGDGFRGGHAGRGVGGGEGLDFHGGHLGRRHYGNFFRLSGLVDSTGQQGDRNGGGGGHDMRCETHRLAAWVELSHRSHRVATPEAPNFLPKIAPIDPEREVIGYNLPVSVWEDRPLQTVKNRTWAEKVSQTHAIDTQARPLVAQLGCDGRRVRACRRRLRLVFASRVAMVVRRSVLNRYGVPV